MGEKHYAAYSSRSREGAWIEIIKSMLTLWQRAGRSREGAWIEIIINVISGCVITVAPVRERGLKLCLFSGIIRFDLVAPVRERGLKLKFFLKSVDI